MVRNGKKWWNISLDPKIGDFEWFGEVLKFIRTISKFGIASHLAHFWSQFFTDFDVTPIKLMLFKTRKSSCVKTQEVYRPLCILSVACPAWGGGGYPVLGPGWGEGDALGQVGVSCPGPGRGGGRAGGTLSWSWPGYPPPPVNWQSENITFPRTSYAGSKYGVVIALWCQ